jgi:hypothetical protein
MSTNIAEMSKTDLLKRAAELNIPGRTRLNLDELREKVIAASPDEYHPSVEMVVNAKRRKTSRKPRDDSGRVIRKGKNLSGNQPFRGKFYYLNPKFANEAEWDADYKLAESAAPMQVRLILKYMRQAKITSPEASKQGAEIAGGAINARVLTTVIPPANLFAYYRKTMETLGLIHDVDHGLSVEEEDALEK